MRWIQPLVAELEQIGSSFPPFVYHYSRPYRHVVAREIELASITADDCVLNVGCGAVPFTAILLAEMTGARVVAVDKRYRAVAAARRCVERLGLPQVSIMQADGSLPLDPSFSVAIVALQAEPKREILRTLKAQAAPGARLVFRIPSQPYQNHYDTLPSALTFAGRVRQEMKTFDYSVMCIA